MKPSATGIPWYRSTEHYAEVLAFMADADKLPDTYEQWLEKAEALEQLIRESGQMAVRVDIDLPQFAKWCGDNGFNVNAHGRSAFASSVAARKVFEQRRGK